MKGFFLTFVFYGNPVLVSTIESRTGLVICNGTRNFISVYSKRDAHHAEIDRKLERIKQYPYFNVIMKNNAVNIFLIFLCRKAYI